MNTINKDLINKYLQGQCNDQEVDAIEQYLADNKLTLDDIVQFSDWQNASQASYKKESLLYTKILEQLRQQQAVKSRNSLVRFMQLAAVLAVLLTLFLFIPTEQQPVSKPQTSLPVAHELTDIPKINNLLFINSSNQDLILYTSDSSKIVLTPGSQIRYAEDFAPLDKRIIQLKGRATFYVTKNKEKPFQVHSKNMITTALGTVFTVDELNSQATRVQLLQGEIEIKQLHKENAGRVNNQKIQQPQVIRHFRKSGELLLDHANNRILSEVKPNINTHKRNGFFKEQQGEIIIKNLAVQDILAILQNNYQVSLQYEESLVKNRYFSGTFPNTKQVYIDVINEINYLHQTHITY